MFVECTGPISAIFRYCKKIDEKCYNSFLFQTFSAKDQHAKEHKKLQPSATVNIIENITPGRKKGELSQNYHRIITELSQNYHRIITELSQNYHSLDHTKLRLSTTSSAGLHRLGLFSLTLFFTQIKYKDFQ